MSNPFGDRDEHQSVYRPSRSQPSARVDDEQQQQQQQQQQMINPADGLDGYDQFAPDRERAMELMGITPTTFSSNIQFQVPRFLQDEFDPAVLHHSHSSTALGPPPGPANSVPTPTYSLAPSSTQPPSNIIQNIQDTTMDFAGNNESYTTSHITSTTGPAASGPYAAFSFPTQSIYSQIPITGSTYPSNNSTAGLLDGSISTGHLSQPQKPPRSSSLALNGLPIYSSSGFDMLDILARIATRPQPKIQLGPVDMSCAFLVVDITRDDSPIIYASNTFSDLTGYPESEVLGQNCRFLQAPPGVKLEKGGNRDHTDMDSVTLMAQNCAQNRECQVTLVNYKKSGEAFINCVSIIPIIPGGNEPVRYQIGFQVDLALQPLAIMRSVQNGSYITNYSTTPLPPVLYQPVKLNMRALSKEMIEIVNKMGTGPASNLAATGASGMETLERYKLSLALLEDSPDAIFVVSLKGSFLYVSPSVTRLLQYEPDYFLNKNLTDICHPSDLAPTMRNVKESSANITTTQPPAAPPTQDIELLFRARRADNTYIWLDCPGKLHADTSRGRKALLLRLREIEMPRMVWSALNSSGGISKDDCYLRVARDDRGLVVACLKGAEEVLGRKRDEVIGKTLAEMVVDDAEGTKREAIMRGLRVGDTACNEIPDSKATRVVFCNMPAPNSAKSNAGEDAPNMILYTTEITFFPPLSMKSANGDGAQTEKAEDSLAIWKMKPQTIVVRIRVLQRQTMGAPARDVLPMGNPYASNSGYYGLPAMDMSFNPIPTPTLRSEDSSSVGRRATRKTGYEVQLTGNVNVIDDSIPTAERPSILPLPAANSDQGGSSGSSGPLGEGGATSNTGAAAAAAAAASMTGSSWQYELQQLRMKNEKLHAELVAVKKDRRVKVRGENVRRGHGSTSRGIVDHSRPVAPVSMSWTGGFAPAPGSGPMTRSSYPTGMPMAHPPSSSAPNPHGYESHEPSESHKRTWSQTDMHSDWNQWGH